MASQCSKEEAEGGRVGYGASQVRAEVEMNDCENLLRAKPQPAGVQIDRKEIDIDRYMCVSLSPSLSVRGRKVPPNKAKCILWCVETQTTSLNKLMHGSHNKAARGMAGNRGLSSPSYSQWVKVQCSSKLFGSLKR